MRVLRFSRLLICLLAILVGVCAADSIELRNGRHVKGKFVGGTTSVVGFMTGGTVEYFSTSDVLVLMFEGGSEGLGDVNPSPMGGKGNDPEKGTLRSLKSRKSDSGKVRLKRTAGPIS